MSASRPGPDAEAILLLCGRFGSERHDAFQPLSTAEYGELAQWLAVRGARPADLLGRSGSSGEGSGEIPLDPARLQFLLGRGTALALALDRWSRAGLWVMARSDDDFPWRLKRRLRQAAPPLLYGAGDRALLDAGGLAIVGSRDAPPAALDFTRSLAAACAADGVAVVSGGARGVDTEALRTATQAGGVALGVLPGELLKTSLGRENRLDLHAGRLALLSAVPPEAAFEPGHAMARNRYIYALSDRAVVVDAALGQGGTWTGATENLRQAWVPLHVRPDPGRDGNTALLAEGAQAFDVDPGQPGALRAWMDRAGP